MEFRGTREYEQSSMESHDIFNLNKIQNSE